VRVELYGILDDFIHIKAGGYVIALLENTDDVTVELGEITSNELKEALLLFTHGHGENIT